jgi:hypothetical protein
LENCERVKIVKERFRIGDEEWKGKETIYGVGD